MLGDGKPNSGTQGSYWRYQYASLKLLEEIKNTIAALPGVDYETRTTTYKATANGVEYSINDILVRYDIIDVTTGLVVSTVWFNQTTQAVIAAPAPADITPYIPPSNVDISSWLGSTAPTVGQKAMLSSLPVVIASNQTAIPVTLPSGAQVLTSSSETGSTNSPVAAGATSVTFTTSSTFTGTINGVTRTASTSYIFEAASGKTLPAISFTVTAGSMIIDKLV